MKYIAGKFNDNQQIYFWKLEGIVIKPRVIIGSYAIVESKNDYDMVKIVGIIDTEEQYERHIAGVNIKKRVVKIIPRKEIRSEEIE